MHEPGTGCSPRNVDSVSRTPPTSAVALYASLGPDLTRYEVDVADAALVRQDTVSLPENVQYAWPHVSGRYLYVASSNRAMRTATTGDRHWLHTFAVDPHTGRLTTHGPAVTLPARPIHITTDVASAFLLVAFSNPGGLRVYGIHSDGTLGAEALPDVPVESGSYPHQVRVTPDNRRVILVARGHDAAPGKAEEPGSLKVIEYTDGRLGTAVSIAPNGGFGFGPRHLDFHPSHPWVYVLLERQNALDMFTLEGGMLSPAPLFHPSSLANPESAPARQIAGPIHVHPNGRFVYVGNRYDLTNRLGENTLAVFEIDQKVGEPRPVQYADAAGVHCRTFHIDPSGRLLVAAHSMPLAGGADAALYQVPAGLVVFRIGNDGHLTFARRYDVDVGERRMFWMGMVTLQPLSGTPA